MTDILIKLAGVYVDAEDRAIIREALAEIEALRSNVSKQALHTVLQEIRFRAKQRERDRKAIREEEKKPSTREVNTS